MLRQRDKQSDIVFQAEETLFNQGTGEVVLTKGAFKTIPVAPGERIFESYANEFCGLTGLSSRTLRFQTEHRDINPTLTISSSCLVKVTHSTEFAPSALANALCSLVIDPVAADIIVKIGDKEFPCYSYMLASRSPVLAQILTEERKEPIISMEGVDPMSAKEVLRWIHTGGLEFPENIFEVIEIAKVAKEWCLAELILKCEDDIKGKLSAENVLDLLVAYGKYKEQNIISEEIWNDAKTLFLREFTYVQQLHADLEEKIASVPGLMSQLFSHALNTKNPKKNRHVRFSVD